MSEAVAERPTIQSLRGRPPKRKYELESEARAKAENKSFNLADAKEGGINTVAVDPVLALKQEEAEMEAFLNEPVTIRINKSMERGFSPSCTELISINGIWAEMLVNNKWVRMGYLPRGRNIVVKRKYIEVLAMAAVETWNTEVLQPVNEDPITKVFSQTTYVLPFSIVHDANSQKGPEWADKLFNRQV